MRPREPLDVGGEPRFGFLPCQTRMHEHERDALQFDGHLRGVVADELARRHEMLEDGALQRHGLLDEHEAVDAPRLLALELADHQQMAQAHHVRILEEVAKRRQHHLVHALGVHLLVRRRVVGDVEQDAALSEEPTRPLQRIAHDGVEYGLLAGKMVVQRRVLDADGRRDVAHRHRMEAARCEQRERLLDDAFLRVLPPHGLSSTKLATASILTNNR